MSPFAVRLRRFELRRVRLRSVCTVCSAFALETSLKKSARGHFALFGAIFPSLAPRFWSSATIFEFSHRKRVHRNADRTDRNAFALFATLIGPFAPCLSRSHSDPSSSSRFVSLAMLVKRAQPFLTRNHECFSVTSARTHQQSDD